MERGPPEQRTATVFGQLTRCGPREVPVADSRSGVGVMQRTRHSSVASSRSLQMRARSTNSAERRSRYREAEMTAVEVLSMTQPPYTLTQAPLRSLALGGSRGRRGGAWGQ